MFKLYCRTYQGVLKLSSYVLPWRQPYLLEGEGSLQELPKLMKAKDLNNVLIVTDAGLVALGLMDDMLAGFAENGIAYTVYDKTVPNPTIDNIEEALEMYKRNSCVGIVAFGGGSPMDCAKGVAARVARPKKSIPQMKGLLKVLKKIPPLVAVPTTAGTGSEVTLVAVITNSKTHEKYAITDTALIPHYAVLDPLLTVNLPPHITATTGIDALTHAVEAYIGRANTVQTKKDSREAIELIFANLYRAYSDGTDIAARSNMMKAAYLAGAAFTRAYVGYVHAIAHTLGGFYSIPHGLANAVILPYVLEYFGQSIHDKLAELSDLVKLSQAGDTDAEKAKRFVAAIKELNQKMDIPEKIKGIEEKDIPLMVERALAEAHPLYPVPKIMSKQEMTEIYYLIKE
ncbi:MAG: iron-containing alcohol dehydrogenase [Firmicutes bacterium]|nr:iron-containing alcohol dehydrogenase [Bacillota bacterium]